MINKNKISKNFGKNLRIARKQKGISQEDLAYKIGFHRTYISMLERGIRTPSLVAIHKIAKELGVEILELIKN